MGTGTTNTPTAMGRALPPPDLLCHGIHSSEETPPPYDVSAAYLGQRDSKGTKIGVLGWQSRAGEVTAQGSDLQY